MTQIITQTPDRIKLPYLFDAPRMLKEVKALNLNHFIYYNVIQLRGPAHLIDASLPPPPPADDYADGSWTDWLDAPELNKAPYLKSVIDTFKAHTTVNLVRLLRLEAGAEVKEHTDPTLGLHIHQSMIRLTIPITQNDEVDFFLNGRIVPLKTGECWYLNLTKKHNIINKGNTERINLSIDVIPNEWVRNMIMNTT